MKYIKIFFPILLAFTMTSCQKVIDIDLNSSNPQYVIEAPLFAGTNDFEVKVTRTSNYFDNAAQPTVDDAVVTISNVSGGDVLTLTPSGNGRYIATAFTAESGNTYQVNVKVGEITFSASSYVPELVTLDSLPYEKAAPSPFGGGDEDEYTVFIAYNEPAATSNFYRLQYIINDTLEKEITVFDDKFTSGNVVRFPLFGERLRIGDQVFMTLSGIDKATFDYLNTLATISENRGGGNSAAPANPIGNWSNGALGYFGAYTQSKNSVVIQ